MAKQQRQTTAATAARKQRLIEAWDKRLARMGLSMEAGQGKLEGARLATVEESVGSNLNLSILKLLSGGDTLSAARMRQDDRQFKPSHKLVLPTNEKPELPNDPAFQGRTYFVPFLADFRDRSKQDPNLEATLRAEAPGILARLIALCPDVIANGLQAPKTVTDATAELLEENDVAKQFQEDMLIDSPGQNVPYDAMESAVNAWLMGGASRGLIAHAHGPNRRGYASGARQGRSNGSGVRSRRHGKWHGRFVTY